MHPRALEGRSLEEARFELFRTFALRLGLLAGILPMLSALRDALVDPSWLLRTLPMRFGVSLILLLYPWCLQLRVARKKLPWILYGSIACVELVLIYGLAQSGMPAGHVDSNWVLLYLIFLGPLLGMPFGLKPNLIGLAVLLTAPALFLVVDPGEGFSFRRFQLMVEPAALILAYLHHLVGKVAAENHLHRQEIERLALQDSLTGLPNRRHFMTVADMGLKQALRTRRPASLLILDIDHFKAINDQFGHGVGDQVIREAGQAFQAALRETDLAARIGGEEFAAFLPDTDGGAGGIAADRVRARIAQLEVHLEGRDEPLQFTVSLGVAVFGGEGDTLDHLMDRADRGLYAAKRGGRNRVELGI